MRALEELPPRELLAPLPALNRRSSGSPLVAARHSFLRSRVGRPPLEMDASLDKPKTRVVNPGMQKSKWQTISKALRKARGTLLILKGRRRCTANAQRRYEAAVRVRDTAIAAFVKKRDHRTSPASRQLAVRPQLLAPAPKPARATDCKAECKEPFAKKPKTSARIAPSLLLDPVGGAPPNLEVGVREFFVTLEDARSIKGTAVRQDQRRASVLGRAPHAEFHRGVLRVSGVWGQRTINDAFPSQFPDWMAALARRVDPGINHAVVIRKTYDHDVAPGVHHWHHHSCEEVGRRSKCYVVSIGGPSVFEIGDGDRIFCTQTLPDRSLLEIMVDADATCKRSTRQGGGVRWSLVFRTIV